MRSGIAAVWMLVFMAPPVAPPADPAAAAMQRGFAWLITQQDDVQGAFAPGQSQPATTALVELAVLRSRVGFSDPFMTRGFEQILRHRRRKGAFYDADQGQRFRQWNFSYNTSLALLALQEIQGQYPREEGDHAVVFRQGRDYLVAMQFTEEDGPILQEDWVFGGWGYNDVNLAPEPDVFTTDWALQALQAPGLRDRASGEDARLPGDSPVWRNALRFLGRCRHEDGGFLYAPRNVEQVYDYRAERWRPLFHPEDWRPTGSMTAAGLVALRSCGESEESDRVRRSRAWLVKSYSPDLVVDPGMPGTGEETLYYYLWTLARAFAPMGPEFTGENAAGETVRIPWARQISDRILALQRPDGSWINRTTPPDTRFPLYAEASPEAATSYAILALAVCREVLGE